MRRLKILVIVMGVMLVAGFAALVAAIAVRVSHRAPAASAGPAFSAPPIELPPGARIEAIGTGPDRITVAIALSDGTRQLLIIDLSSGRRLGMIPLREAK